MIAKEAIEAFYEAHDQSLALQPREHHQAVYEGLVAALAAAEERARMEERERFQQERLHSVLLAEMKCRNRLNRLRGYRDVLDAACREALNELNSLKIDAYALGFTGNVMRDANGDRVSNLVFTAEIAESEAARLRALLAEARKVVEPFAALPDNAHGKQRYFLQLLMCPEGDVPADGTRHYGPAIRAARALAEKLEKEISNG